MYLLNSPPPGRTRVDCLFYAFTFALPLLFVIHSLNLLSYAYHLLSFVSCLLCMNKNMVSRVVCVVQTLFEWRGKSSRN